MVYTIIFYYGKIEHNITVPANSYIEALKKFYLLHPGGYKLKQITNSMNYSTT